MVRCTQIPWYLRVKQLEFHIPRLFQIVDIYHHSTLVNFILRLWGWRNPQKTFWAVLNRVTFHPARWPRHREMQGIFDSNLITCPSHQLKGPQNWTFAVTAVAETHLNWLLFIHREFMDTINNHGENFRDVPAVTTVKPSDNFIHWYVEGCFLSDTEQSFGLLCKQCICNQGAF